MSDQPNAPESAAPAPETAPTPAVTLGDSPAPAAEAPAAPQPARRKPGTEAGGYFWGTGRRKTSVARVRIKPGDGKFFINGKKEIKDFFFSEQHRRDVVAPMAVTKTHGKFDVFVNVHGGGQTGQAGAVLLGLSRALATANSEYEPALREHEFLSRDARKVERKKPGQPGARKRFQFSKR